MFLNFLIYAGITISTDDISLEDVMIFLAVLLGLMIVVFVFLGIVLSANKAEEERKPIENGIAVLMEKQQSTNSLTAAIDNIPAIFELEDGRRIKLSLEANSTLVIGDRGEITWQGSKVIKFQRI